MIKGKYFMLFLLLIGSPIFADDLNDGIAIDEPVDDGLQMQKNSNFIERNAMAKALRGDKKTIVDCGTGNQVFGPGANLKGATIVNLSNNKNSTSVCNPNIKNSANQDNE
jgi:hypothetical protein